MCEDPSEVASSQRWKGRSKLGSGGSQSLGDWTQPVGHTPPAIFHPSLWSHFPMARPIYSLAAYMHECMTLRRASELARERERRSDAKLNNNIGCRCRIIFILYIYKYILPRSPADERTDFHLPLTYVRYILVKVASGHPSDRPSIPPFGH